MGEIKNRITYNLYIHLQFTKYSAKSEEENYSNHLVSNVMAQMYKILRWLFNFYLCLLSNLIHCDSIWLLLSFMLSSIQWLTNGSFVT